MIKEVRGNKSETCGILGQVCGNRAGGQPGYRIRARNR